MKNNVRKRSWPLPLVVTVILALFASVAVGAEEATPINPGPETVLPDYIGAPAKAHPAANSGVPQNPFLAPNPFNTVHVDPWMSDVVDIAGLLGRDPVVLSSTLEEARNYSNSTIFQCVGAAFDLHGHLVTPCTGTGPSGQEASVVLTDARSLEVLDHYHLPTYASSLSALSSCYWYADNQDRFIMSAGPNRIIALVVGGSEANPVFELPPSEYNLSEVVPADDSIAGVMSDWQGRIWFVTAGKGGAPAKACVINPATYKDPATDLNVKCEPFGGNDAKTGKHEQIFNTFAATKTGVYIVTSEKMYRVWAGSDDDPYMVWSEPYNTVLHHEEAQARAVRARLRHQPDDPRRRQVRRDHRQRRAVAGRCVPDRRTTGPERGADRLRSAGVRLQGGSAGALSNSLIGTRLSLIAENTYGYAIYWQQDGIPAERAGLRTDRHQSEREGLHEGLV